MARVLKRSQFYLHTPRSSAHGMLNLCLPSRSWYSFTDPAERWKAELALGYILLGLIGLTDRQIYIIYSIYLMIKRAPSL